MIVKVTPRMLQTITAMQRFKGKHGHMPSYRELLPHLGLRRSSVASAYDRIAELEHAGVITRSPGLARAYAFRPGLTVVCDYPRKEQSCV